MEKVVIINEISFDYIFNNTGSRWGNIARKAVPIKNIVAREQLGWAVNIFMTFLW
jgi:hypothetical protein